MAQVNIDIAKEESVQQVKTLSNATKGISESVVSAIGTSADVGETTVMGKLNALGGGGDIQKYIFSPPIVNAFAYAFPNNSPVEVLEKAIDITGEGAIFSFSARGGSKLQIFADGVRVANLVSASVYTSTEWSIATRGGETVTMPGIGTLPEAGGAGVLAAPVYFKHKLEVYMACTSASYAYVSVSYGLY